jgi:hypothetical protein
VRRFFQQPNRIRLIAYFDPDLTLERIGVGGCEIANLLGGQRLAHRSPCVIGIHHLERGSGSSPAASVADRLRSEPLPQAAEE